MAFPATLWNNLCTQCSLAVGGDPSDITIEGSILYRPGCDADDWGQGARFGLGWDTPVSLAFRHRTKTAVFVPEKIFKNSY